MNNADLDVRSVYKKKDGEIKMCLGYINQRA